MKILGVDASEIFSLTCWYLDKLTNSYFPYQVRFHIYIYFFFQPGYRISSINTNPPRLTDFGAPSPTKFNMAMATRDLKDFRSNSAMVTFCLNLSLHTMRHLWLLGPQYIKRVSDRFFFEEKLRNLWHNLSWNLGFFHIWCFPKNRGTPKSSILIGFSIIFTIHFGGPPLFLNNYVFHTNLFPGSFDRSGPSLCWDAHWSQLITSASNCWRFPTLHETGRFFEKKTLRKNTHTKIQIVLSSPQKIYKQKCLFIRLLVTI